MARNGGRKRRQETQCKDAGGCSSLLWFPEKHIKSRHGGALGPGNTGMEEDGEDLKCSPKRLVVEALIPSL